MSALRFVRVWLLCTIPGLACDALAVVGGEGGFFSGVAGTVTGLGFVAMALARTGDGCDGPRVTGAWVLSSASSSPESSTTQCMSGLTYPGHCNR